MRIELQNITKTFGHVRANDRVSVVVEAGTIHGLLGENGAGKTTLMKILSGYQSCDSGTISLDGQTVQLNSPAQAIRAGIGMLHQDPLDVPALSILDNFILGGDGSLRQDRPAARARLRTYSQRFGFSLDPDVQVSSLTIGERQQLELVRLLALGVRTVILDEPTTGISAPQKQLLFATLHELAADGLSVIFVSHKLDEVEQLCSVVTVLRQGRVAGQVKAPFSTARLVELMFGQELCKSPRPHVDLGAVALELRDVCLHSHRLHLEHLDLALRCGEVVGLAGLEGSGQQLLMRACAGIQSLDAGRLWVNGEELTGRPYQRFLQAGVGFVPAARLEEGLVPGLRLREHFALADRGASFFVPWAEADRRAERMIEEFNIIGRPDTLVQELSGGNQQRALLSLLPERLQVLILEHPTRGLDIESADWIWQKLLARRAEGTALLFTSTDLDELVENSDRIIVFSGGTMSAPYEAGELTCEQLGYLIGGRGL